MLRRYNSRNLETFLLKTRKTTIGSDDGCDIVLKGKGVDGVHVSIESNSNGYFLKEHSLAGITRVNDRPFVGQIQIHSGDKIQIGACPLVFDEEWLIGTRPNSAKVMAKAIGGIPKKEEPMSSMLPMITGKKIHPLTPQQSLSDSSVKKRTVYSRFGGPPPPQSGNQSLRSSASSTESQHRSTAFYTNNRSTGVALLQKVVKLQEELISRDAMVSNLIRQLHGEVTGLKSAAPYSYHPTTLPPSFLPPFHHTPYQAPPFQAPPLQAPPPSNRSNSSQQLQKTAKSFELAAYRAFVGAITSQLRQFNDRVLRHPQRDSAELFNSMCRAVDLPLESRIKIQLIKTVRKSINMPVFGATLGPTTKTTVTLITVVFVDIIKFCEADLIDKDFEDGDELMIKLEHFIRESRRDKILELIHELEVLMPLIRDAASNARENIKVCNVFTQWSREFGDIIRKKHITATILFQAIDDLMTQFSEAHMSRHWLPPSITPILRLAALELDKRDGNVTPSMSPRPPPVLDRKKSIDMTLDTCISQVETIIHEMDYHVVRLYNKAKDYSTFQPLDLDTVTRVSKIVESMKSSVELLGEHSFKEDRPNSVLFFKITNEDIKNSIRKSDGEGSGSLSSSKKVSVAPKIPENFSEDEEILEERKEVETEIQKIIEKIGEKIGEGEEAEPTGSHRMISVDASVLKKLIQESQRLTVSYDFEKSESRRKRSVPPTITVEDILNSEDVKIQEVVPVEAEVTPSEEASEEISEDVATPESQSFEIPAESLICSKPAQLPLAYELPDFEVTAPSAPPPEDVPHLNLETSEEDATTPEVVTPRDSEESGPESRSRPATPEYPTPKNIASGADLPFTLIMPEQPGNPEQSAASSPDLIPEVDDVESLNSNSDDQDSEESEDVEPEESEGIDDVSESEDDKTTVLYIPSAATPQELTPQDSLHSESLDDVKDSEDVLQYSEDIVGDSEAPEDVLQYSEAPEKVVENVLEPIGNGDVIHEIHRAEDPISSHLKSHMNTANGKPHITYQYPIRRYYSPPMKRRSKSEDQKIRETLKSRPPFVLY
ncbi:hypothetical protein CRE_29070 [Caenorhabditis remanei]|uniref:YscD cytoplasmic domain-containing protein n=1 Tax=Caenorhabditis remanei TaxID=31234 RepID=E3MW93_CAERE|nr:hypothetical protein CRE_29070 [Caenorhabditis remanei]